MTLVDLQAATCLNNLEETMADTTEYVNFNVWRGIILTLAIFHLANHHLFLPTCHAIPWSLSSSADHIMLLATICNIAVMFRTSHMFVQNFDILMLNLFVFETSVIFSVHFQVYACECFILVFILLVDE